MGRGRHRGDRGGGGAVPTLDDIREFCRDRLAAYKVPLRIEIVEEVPRNPAGKILKYRLREQFGGE